MPLRVSRVGRFAMPALATMASKGAPSDEMCCAARATAARSAKSQAAGVQDGPTRLHASVAASSERASPMTWAPFAASACMVSKPMPEVQPVTTIRRPLRSTPART